MGEANTLRGDAARSGPPGREDEEWAGKLFIVPVAVKRVASSAWRCLECPTASSGIAEFDQMAAEDHAEKTQHLVVWDMTVTFVPGSRT